MEFGVSVKSKSNFMVAQTDNVVLSSYVETCAVFLTKLV